MTILDIAINNKFICIVVEKKLKTVLPRREHEKAKQELHPDYLSRRRKYARLLF